MLPMTDPQIARFLDDALIGRLCMAGADGRPYAIPLPFCWSSGALYLRIPLTGRKGSILTRNDHVCFEVDQFTDSLDAYASVLVEGRLIEVTDLSEKEQVKAVTAQKYLRLRKGHRPGHGRSTPTCDLPLRKIVPDHISGRQNAPPAPAPQSTSSPAPASTPCAAA